MQARVRAGVSYREYSSHLGEAKCSVEAFIESTLGTRASELVVQYPRMTEAMERGSIRIEDALPVIWNAASDRIAEAAKLIGD